MFDLQGRVAVVTGGGRGIGRAIAEALARANAAVALVARTSPEVEAVASDLRARGCRACAITCDVTDASAVREMVLVCARALGSPDIVVNNAGNAVVKPLVPLPGHLERGEPDEAVTDAEWHGVLDTHLTGTFLVLREAVPGMLERGHGRVINISSVTTARAGKYTVPYDAAKGALISFTRSVAHEWARYGVTANVIAPGQFPTAMSAPLHASERGREWLRSRIPARRVGQPREIGPLALYLASDEAAFMTGQCIFIDGGESL